MVIVINGPVASGKSTVAFALADMLAKAGTKKVEVFDENMNPEIIRHFRKTPLKKIAKLLNNRNDSGVTIITEQPHRKVPDQDIISLHQRIYHTVYKVKAEKAKNANG